ncbi:hypothetical protein TSAR_001712 [Trichomalopsis sarcophagae]|uniref:Uncharacterized protein n=1 Tax=Trichomalopsis sarcophagae TaxID=543379 RepID=A0A232F688_9HYME|nr:hypothetical protein TSAR_001712 [Trichomalopsis sarcophagae]
MIFYKAGLFFTNIGKEDPKALSSLSTVLHGTSRPIRSQNIKKNSMSESSSDIMELEEGILLRRSGIIKKPTSNPHYNNNIHLACLSIETDV